MEEKSEDLPKSPLPRRAARPFVSPSEGVTGPFELRRRGAQLFTPPGSTPATPAADTLAATNAETTASQDPSAAADGSPELSASTPADQLASGEPSLADVDPALAPEPSSVSNVDFEGDWSAAPMITPERTLDAESLLETQPSLDDDTLVVEQFEHEEIELTPAPTGYTDEHSIEVIAYDDANSLLQAAAPDGKHPKVDGLQLETTEFSFEQEPAPPRMNADSFWATEPFAAMQEPEQPMEAAHADDAEATIDADTAGEPVLAANAEATARTIDEQPIEWADDPSTTISHAQAALEPEPEHTPIQESAPAPMLADIAPPWMNRLTPVSTKALEELKEAEPWDLTPAYGVAAIPAEEPAGAPDPQMATSSEAPVGTDVADALERIAMRLRAGELEVHAEAEMSDEAALSAVLTALLRARR